MKIKIVSKNHDQIANTTYSNNKQIGTHNYKQKIDEDKIS